MFKFRTAPFVSRFAIPSGIDYTATVGFLAIALLFAPAMLIFAQPIGAPFLYSSIAIIAVALLAAWISWVRSSQLGVLSIANENPRRPR